MIGMGGSFPEFTHHFGKLGGVPRRPGSAGAGQRLAGGRRWRPLAANGSPGVVDSPGRVYIGPGNPGVVLPLGEDKRRVID